MEWRSGGVKVLSGESGEKKIPIGLSPLIHCSTSPLADGD